MLGRHQIPTAIQTEIGNDRDSYSSALNELVWLHQHYPDGPDSVGVMNQTFLALEELVRSTVHTSLSRVELGRTFQHTRSLRRKAIGMFLFGVFGVIIVQATPADPATKLLFAILTICAAILGIHYFMTSKENSGDRTHRLSNFARNERKLRESAELADQLRNSLSHRSIAALEHPPTPEQRIDRFTYDECLIRLVNNEKAERVVELSADAAIVDRKSFNWVNGLWNLERYLTTKAGAGNENQREQLEWVRESLRESIRTLSANIVLLPDHPSVSAQTLLFRR